MNRFALLSACILALFLAVVQAQPSRKPAATPPAVAPSANSATTPPAPGVLPSAVSTEKSGDSASVPATAPDSLSAQDESIRIKKTAVAFMGLESITENRFHETLEERIYLKLSYNKNVSLEPRDFFFKAKSRGFVVKKLLSMNEAVELMKLSGDRIFVSGEIRDFKISLRRTFGFLPFGKVQGEIVCYLQVLDALEKEPRFAGNIKFIGEMNAGWVGFSSPESSLPLSPVEEKHFRFELINGLGETFTETAEAAYVGIIEKKAQNVVKKTVIRRENRQRPGR
ncbi:MAG: hypothetical protein V1913_03020 [Fibrobacterota bacterium]